MPQHFPCSVRASSSKTAYIMSVVSAVRSVVSAVLSVAMQAAQGGAVFLTQGGDALFQNTTFADNHAEEVGGSITITSFTSVVGRGLNCRNNSVSVDSALIGKFSEQLLSGHQAQIMP